MRKPHAPLPWRIVDQYIVSKHTGEVVCEWGSYTTLKNARLIVRLANITLSKIPALYIRQYEQEMKLAYKFTRKRNKK